MATDKDLATTQDQLIKLLRESPTLTTVVAHDPSLLANQEYVQRNNPQLAQFLQSHPEIPLNPDYYLFTNIPGDNGPREQILERAVWPELVPVERPRPLLESISNDIAPLIVFVGVCIVLVWLVRIVVENRRWNRVFKLQMDVHSRLIDKFSTNQELFEYMQTEAGKRFLEAAPIPISYDAGPDISPRMPNAVARVLTPLQLGIVLSLLGAGLLAIRHAQTEMDIPMLVLGTLILMPGLGFIISAGVTWFLAGRLGLMPELGATHSHLASNDLRDRRE